MNPIERRTGQITIWPCGPSDLTLNYHGGATGHRELQFASRNFLYTALPDDSKAVVQPHPIPCLSADSAPQRNAPSHSFAERSFCEYSSRVQPLTSSSVYPLTSLIISIFFLRVPGLSFYVQWSPSQSSYITFCGENLTSWDV